MSRTVAEITEWARQHRACYEVTPLVEMSHGQKVQVGFRVTLLAALPTDVPPGAERDERAREVILALRELAQSLAPREDGPARVELDPPRAAALLRPENEMKPELSQTFQVFHKEGYFTAVTEAERGGIGQLDAWFSERGLRKGHW